MAAGQPRSERRTVIRCPKARKKTFTLWISLNFKILEEEQDPVPGFDVDEPVALFVAGVAAAVRVLLGEVGARDHAVLEVGDVAAAL